MNGTAREAAAPCRFRRASWIGWCLTVVLAASFMAKANAAETYHTKEMCDGYPAVTLKTPHGLCVGLVADHLGFPRGVADDERSIYVVDMGGWRKGHGRILRLDKADPTRRTVLLKGLDEPNALAPGPDGTLYVGVLGRVIRFDPRAADPAATMREVVVGLPDTGRHPLTAIAVATDGSLFLNVGSKTDNCETEDGDAPNPKAPCPETTETPPRGSIIHVVLRPGGAVDAATAKVVARGLRNSLGLAILPDGQLIAAVNARDAIDTRDPKLSDDTLPHDTLDWIVAGTDYGWPYCFDDKRPAPEYPYHDCSAMHAPDLLLPPHAAPLGLLYYTGTKLPGLADRLVIPFHGYRKGGHRIVSLALDADDRPEGRPANLVWGWDDAPGSHPQGAPVALAAMCDGSILITEDVNGTLLRLSRR
jgi:glucose/arabinose dehydrogenase